MTWWNDYIAIPYKDHGDDRSGCDCGGLVRLVYRELKKIELPEYLQYETSNESAQCMAAIEEASAKQGWQEVTEPQDFDVVVLRIGSMSCHVGIVCNGGKAFLHVTQGTNVSIEPLTSARWILRIVDYWRHI